jgi:DNA topoisomerase-1
MLESEGIGRPSTYASIIGTIIDRGYAQLVTNALVPTFTAFAVTSLLEKYFPELVDPRFTSRMEQTLDDISTGETQWLPYLNKFYLGETGLRKQVDTQESQIDASVARTVELENLDAKVRIGRFGPYIEVQNGEGAVTASIPKNLTPADLDPERVEVLLRQKTEGPDIVGQHPQTGEPIYLKVGTYGPYVQLGEETSDAKKKPKTMSLPKGVTPENVTLEMAVGLLSLPRPLGVHPETGGKISVSLGRFGPYVLYDQGKDAKEYRSLKSTDDVLTIDFKRALELLAEPKKGGRGTKGKTKEPLKALGNHPADDEPVNIYDGPYGAYVKHGKTNASIPEGETVETLTLAKAVELLAAKASGGSKKAGTRKTSTRTKKS